MTPSILMVAAGWGAAGVLGYRPFLAPLPIDDYWLVLLLPLVWGISVVYKAIKLEDLGQLYKQAAVLTAQILTFMVLAAAGLWLVSELL